MKANDANRRDFLRSTALTAAASVLASRMSAQEPPPPGGRELPLVPGVSWHKAPCRFCGTGCHVQVGVSQGKVVAISGDRHAEVNRGLLCVKGYHVGQILYGKDRLTTPLVRRDGRLVPIDWDEAIDIIARRILAAPDRFAMYGSGQWTITEGYAANKFMKAGLSNNHIDPNARLCMASAVTGYISTYGVDEPYNCYDDLDHCDVLILWGNNFAEMHPVLFSRFIDRKLKGDRITLIDLATRWTRSSSRADYVMIFTPHSDLAIANCIAYQVIEAKAVAKEFVERHCVFRKPWKNPNEPQTLLGETCSFEEYQKLVSTYTPEKVAQTSGLSVDQLRMLGRLFIDRSKKITSVWCMGVNQHTQGTAMNNLIHAIHLLSGHWGQPGDGPQSLTGQPSACGTVREVGTLAHGLPGDLRVDNPEHAALAEKLWNVPAGRILRKPGYHTVLMWEKFCTPSDQGGDIQTIWVQVTNPGQSLPNANKLFEAKQRLTDKFLIVSDVYPTTTTRLADLVLPSAMWVEKNGIFGNSERRTQQWFKMVDPPGDARDDCWQIIAVAQRLAELGHTGMKDKDGKFLFHLTDEKGAAVEIWKWQNYYGRVNVDEKLYEEYRQFTIIKHKDVAPYAELVKSRGLRWPVIQQPDGSWKETRYRFIEGLDPYVASGKGVQFYHAVGKDDRAVIWFRPYVPPPEIPDAEYPFWLDTGRVLEHWHTATMTGRVPMLKRAMPESYVEMNREDAAELGLRHGDLVRVQTRRGSLDLPVWIDGRGQCPRGHLFVPFFDENRLINRLTLDECCPFSKEPDFKKCAARVVKVIS
jgi:nitrate reductase NapA